MYSSGWTALHEASLAGFFEATNELLKAGADVNSKGYEQVTPLHDAVKEGHYKVTFLCLKMKCHLYYTKVFLGAFRKVQCISLLTLTMISDIEPN